LGFALVQIPDVGLKRKSNGGQRYQIAGKSYVLAINMLF
jgi:hypothetical protein